MTIREYLTPQGRSPFRDWLRTLDLPLRARIQARVLRFELGNFGNSKSVGDGVWEGRIMFGPGYRIYFGKQGHSVVLLLLGGTKDKQIQDIARAKSYWREYRGAVNHGKTQ